MESSQHLFFAFNLTTFSIVILQDIFAHISREQSKEIIHCSRSTPPHTRFSSYDHTSILILRSIRLYWSKANLIEAQQSSQLQTNGLLKTLVDDISKIDQLLMAFRESYSHMWITTKTVQVYSNKLLIMKSKSKIIQLRKSLCN